MRRLKGIASLVRYWISTMLPEILLFVVCWRADAISIFCAVFAYAWALRQVKRERERLKKRIENLETIRMQGKSKFIFSMRIKEHKG